MTTTSFDQDKAGRLRFAIALTGVVFVGELVGGLWTGSLALLSDAAHVFSDILALGLSLIALALACRPAGGRHSYGLHRAEVFAALINAVTLLVICALILREAYLRLTAPAEIKSLEMLAIATVGLVANWIVLSRLGAHDRRDLNLRSAYLHVLGDLLASVGVVIAAVIITLTGWNVVDPLLSIGIAGLIVVNALRVLGEALHILLEGVPRGIELEDVAEALRKVPGVRGVHHLHAWSICSNMPAFSAHVVTCPDSEAERAATRAALENILVHRFGFADTTLEFECKPCADDDLMCKVNHGMTANHPGHHHPNHTPNHAADTHTHA